MLGNVGAAIMAGIATGTTGVSTLLPGVNKKMAQDMAVHFLGHTIASLSGVTGINPAGVGEFRTYSNRRWGKNLASLTAGNPYLQLDQYPVPDIFMGPVPLYGVRSMDFAESEADTKFRAKYSEFYGHQEGQAFAMSINGVVTGELGMVMVNLLRLLKLVCGLRKETIPHEGQQDIEERYFRYEQQEDPSGAGNAPATFVRSMIPGNNVIPGSIRIRPIVGESGEERWRWMLGQDNIRRHFAFPVVTRWTTFNNLYIENLSFQQDAEIHGQDSLEYTIHLRREMVPRHLKHGIITKNVGEETYKVGVSFYVDDALPLGQSAADVFMFMSTMVPEAVISAVNITERLNGRKLDVLNGLTRSSSAQLDPYPVKIKKSRRVTSTMSIPVYHGNDGTLETRGIEITKYLEGTASIDKPANACLFSVTGEGFDDSISFNFKMEGDGVADVEHVARSAGFIEVRDGFYFRARETSKPNALHDLTLIQAIPTE